MRRILGYCTSFDRQLCGDDRQLCGDTASYAINYVTVCDPQDQFLHLLRSHLPSAAAATAAARNLASLAAWAHKVATHSTGIVVLVCCDRRSIAMNKGG